MGDDASAAGDGTERAPELVVAVGELLACHGTADCGADEEHANAGVVAFGDRPGEAMGSSCHRSAEPGESLPAGGRHSIPVPPVQAEGSTSPGLERSYGLVGVGAVGGCPWFGLSRRPRSRASGWFLRSGRRA
jgi:hypothetical protein